jgi:DNA-directed RNA polymerase subunit RPC12/RpoP
MAEGVRYICESCSRAVESWSDGNPYWIDSAGGKHYAYHPDHENLERCIGNDSPHLCLACGQECMVDSRSPITACPTCSEEKLADTWELGGQPCPYCKEGVFGVVPEPSGIS